VGCKRIHNFYTNERYKRGYEKHYKRVEDERLLSTEGGSRK
jgi:hypothetical protein